MRANTSGWIYDYSNDLKCNQAHKNFTELLKADNGFKSRSSTELYLQKTSQLINIAHDS